MISARGLGKRYGDVLAVDGLTFDVTPGAVTGFLGANGSGKSTTMRMALGLDAPSAGSITVGGAPYREHAAPARVVGALLDPRAMHPGRTARGHLRWMAAAAGVARSRVGVLLEEVGIAHAADRRIGTFSLGMRQRLGIAGALLGDPGILLLDEPLNGLDPAGIRWVRTLLRDLAEQGRTVFVSSHLMNEMEETAERVVIIGNGRLIDSVDVAELRSRVGGVRVVPVDGDAVAGLRALLRHAGAEVAPGPGDLPALDVRGLAAERIGMLACENRVALRELTPHADRLEASFLALTAARTEGEPA